MSKRKAMASTAVVVLGMHRSGTSALTACLQALGASLGHDLVPPNHDNPGGYFENAAAVTAHDTLLAELDRGWEDLRELPADWMESEYAQRADARVRALLREEFADAPLWALKDPRLCRLLPLWKAPLADAGIDARQVLVVRHPDEVVASLVKRDGMAAEHGYLLWLRYVLDAMRDGDGTRRVLLDYDALLDAPAATMERVGEALGIDWPTPVAAAGLDAVLDAGKRHHRPSADTPAADSARAQALALYRDATAEPRRWADHAEARAWLDARLLALAPWLDDAGNALARVRREAIALRAQCAQTEQGLRRVDALSRERLGQLHALQARIEATDDALQASAALSIQRLEELRALHARLAATDAALDEAKALSLAQLRDIAELDRRIAVTQSELTTAQALALERMADAAALDRRVAAIEATALERLATIEAQERRIAETDAALHGAQALSFERLRALDAMRAQVAATEAGLREATTLSLSRLDEIGALHVRLKAIDDALAVSSALAIERLRSVEALQQRQEATDVALEHAGKLALERLAAIEAMDARLRDTDAALQAAQARSAELAVELAHRNQRLGEREAAIMAMEASRSWRLTRPLRWLEARLSRRREPR